MKRPRLSSGKPSPSTSAKKAYEEIFNSDPAHMQALRELFPADGEEVAQAAPPLGTPIIGLLASGANLD